MNFKIGDKVKVVRARFDHKAKHIGQTFTIRDINPNGPVYSEIHYGVVERDECIFVWFNDELELVEDKKVFTKKDLKSGMFGYFDNETDDWFVIAGDRFIYQQGLGDDVSMVNDNLESPAGRKITALYSARSFNHATKLKGELIWKREEDKPKSNPLYNGKVVCIDNTENSTLHTVGKIYQFKDGKLIADNGRAYPSCEGSEVYTFEDWAKWTASKFIEIKE